MVLCFLLCFTIVSVAAIFAAKTYKEIDPKQHHALIVDNAYKIESGKGKEVSCWFRFSTSRVIYDKPIILIFVSD